MRTVIKSLGHNGCSVTADDEFMHVDGPVTERVTTEYWAPASGGYVYDVTKQPGTLGRQVCDGLSNMGNTLRWSGTVPLVNLIRSEHRSAKRRQRVLGD